MKVKFKKKPREYVVGINKKICLKDYGKIFLNNNEQITFVTNSSAEHDVTRKSWGFYATQSVNYRLKKKFKTALVINPLRRIYIMLVEKKFLNKFRIYCKAENQKVLLWLDELK